MSSNLRLERRAKASQGLSVMYVEILDGLRGSYEDRLQDKSGAGYQAAMSMSCLFGANAADLLVIANALSTGDLSWVAWLYDHKLLLLAFGVLTAWGHVRFAKAAGVYKKSGPAESPTWKRAFFAYCGASLLLFLAAFTVALVV